VNDGDEGFEPWCFNNYTEWGNYSYLATSASGGDYDAFHLNDGITGSNLQPTYTASLVRDSASPFTLICGSFC
jgi:hypothetical protein